MNTKEPDAQHEIWMNFKFILKPNPEQKSNIENIHIRSMLHLTPCKEKQSSRFITTYNINNIPQGHLLSWVATSLFCPCLHCLNTEWFALDWNLLDGLAAERQHQKMRGKKTKITATQPALIPGVAKAQGDFDPQTTHAEICSLFPSRISLPLTPNTHKHPEWLQRSPAPLGPQRSLLSSARHALKWEQPLGHQQRKLNRLKAHGTALIHSQHPSRLLEKVCS